MITPEVGNLFVDAAQIQTKQGLGWSEQIFANHLAPEKGDF